MRTRQPHEWNPESHLLLGVIELPLLVKKLLEGEGLYRVSETDRAEVPAFARSAADFGDPKSRLKNW